MGKYTEQELFSKLERADAAGDAEAARAIASEIRSMRAAGQQPATTPPSQPAYAGPKPVTDDMSGYDRFMAGAGKAASDTWLGTKQLGALVGNTVGAVDDSTVDDLFMEAHNRNERDADLMGTGAGFAGNIAGNIATLLAPAGAVRAVGAIPQVSARLPALAGIGSAMALPKTAGQALAMGGVAGAVQPTESVGGKVGMTLGSSVLGLAPMAAASLWQAAAKKASALTVAGQVRNMADGIRLVLGDQFDNVVAALSKAPQGATAGEVQGVPFVSALQRTAMQTHAPVMQKVGGYMDDVSRTMQNRLADEAGDSAGLIAARRAETEPLYAMTSEQEVPIDKFLVNLLRADPAKKGMEKAAQVFRTEVASEGRDPRKISSIIPPNAVAIKGAPLMNLKKEMAGLKSDDISKTAVIKWNKSFNSWLRDNFSDYKAADDVYADMSKGINQSQILEEVLRRGTNIGNGKLQPHALLKAIESKTLPKTATGWDKAQWADLTKTQKKVLVDAARFARGRYALDTAGKTGAGSDTVQKATISKMLEENALPPLLSNLLGTKTMGASKAGERLYEGYARQKAGEALSDLLIDPQYFAASLKRAKIPNTERSLLTRLMATGGATAPALYGPE